MTDTEKELREVLGKVVRDWEQWFARHGADRLDAAPMMASCLEKLHAAFARADELRQQRPLLPGDVCNPYGYPLDPLTNAEPS